MGTLIKAICTSCDFRKKFSFGGGMMEYDKICRVPAIGNDKKFLVVNTKEDLPDGVKLYTNTELYVGELKEGEGIQHSEHWLSPSNNLCPNCKLKVMDFEVYGKFD